MRYISEAKIRLLNFAAGQNVALAQNLNHQFAAAYALCIYRMNAVYTMIPKNACSTLRFSIAVANGCTRPDGDYRWIHRNNATFAADLRSLITASFTFTVLRCPFERLTSCFLDKVVDVHPHAWALTPQTETERTPTDLTFREFVRLLADSRKLRSDSHWRPQCDFLVYDRYDRYFDFRDIVQMAQELKVAGLDLIDMRSKTRHSVSAYSRIEGSFADVTVGAIAAMKRSGRLPAMHALYDSEIWDAVAGLYSGDLAAYVNLAGGTASERPEFP